MQLWSTVKVKCIIFTIIFVAFHKYGNFIMNSSRAIYNYITLFFFVCYINNASVMLHKGGDDTEYTLKSVDVVHDISLKLTMTIDSIIRAQFVNG